MFIYIYIYIYFLKPNTVLKVLFAFILVNNDLENSHLGEKEILISKISLEKIPVLGSNSLKMLISFDKNFWKCNFYCTVC